MIQDGIEYWLTLHQADILSQTIVNLSVIEEIVLYIFFGYIDV